MMLISKNLISSFIKNNRIWITQSPIKLNFFSSSRVLSESAQKAIWAAHIIKVIEESELPKDIAEPSVRQRILSLKVPDARFDFSQDCRSSVLRLFREGLQLDQRVYGQEQFLRSSQPKAKQTAAGSQHSPPTFVFAPNALVTTSIFRFLNRREMDDFLIWGRFGIGKTAATILYLHLSDFITGYFYEAHADPDKAAELRLLQAMRLLQPTAFKYFYWSVSYNDLLKQHIVQTAIIRQARELTQQQRTQLKNCEDPQQFRLLLHSFYPATITVASIADQVNVLTAAIYQSHYQMAWIQAQLKDDEPCYSCETLVQRFDSILKKKCIPTLQLQQILCGFVRLGQYYRIISSYPVQKHILGPNTAENRLIHLNIRKKDNIPFYRVPIQGAFSKPGGCTQFSHMMWHEIQRRMKINQYANATISSARQLFFSQIAHEKLWGFTQIEKLIALFEQNQPSLFPSSQQQFFEKKFILNLVEAIKTLQQEAIQHEESLFHKFFVSQNTNKKVFYCKRLAENLLQDSKKRQELIEISAYSSQVQMLQLIHKQNMNNHQFRREMPFQILYNGNIRLPWTPEQFLKIFQESIFYGRKFEGYNKYQT